MNVNKALEQVQQLQMRVIENRKFHGWSGRARITSGIAALAMAVALHQGVIRVDEYVHLGCWCALLIVSLLINTLAMGLWFYKDPKVSRDWRKLRPLLDPLPPLAVGGLLSIALIVANQWSLVVGVWTLQYGLANYSLRKVLPRHIMYVAVFYLTLGTVYLIFTPNFLTPWPMGLAFCIGEVAGGSILHFNQNREIG